MLLQRDGQTDTSKIALVSKAGTGAMLSTSRDLPLGGREGGEKILPLSPSEGTLLAHTLGLQPLEIRECLCGFSPSGQQCF